MKAAGPAAGPPSDDSGRCRECGTLSGLADEYLQAFGLCVCRRCARDGAGYELMPKSRAKEQFLLTDRDTAKLGYTTKPNPRHESWKQMQLFCLCQLEDVAREKHGSLHELESLRTTQLEARLLKGAAKKRKLEGSLLAGMMADGGLGGGAGCDGAGGGAGATREQRVLSRVLQEHGGAAGAEGGGGGGRGLQRLVVDVDVEQM